MGRSFESAPERDPRDGSRRRPDASPAGDAGRSRRDTSRFASAGGQQPRQGGAQQGRRDRGGSQRRDSQGLPQRGEAGAQARPAGNPQRRRPSQQMGPAAPRQASRPLDGPSRGGDQRRQGARPGREAGPARQGSDLRADAQRKAPAGQAGAPGATGRRASQRLPQDRGRETGASEQGRHARQGAPVSGKADRGSLRQHSRYSEEMRFSQRASAQRGSARRSGAGNRRASRGKKAPGGPAGLAIVPVSGVSAGSQGSWKSSSGGKGGAFGRGLLGALSALLRALGRGLSFLGRAVAGICRRSKGALAVVLVAAVLVVGGAVDSFANMGKVYGHVSVGEVDASGMTPDELSQALLDRYGTSLAASGVTIYASEEAMANHDQTPDSGNLSVEEQAAQATSWYADKNSLQAYIDYDSLVDQAMQAGRGGFWDRVKLFFGKRTVDVGVNYNDAIIESLASTMDLALGYSYVNSEVSVQDGVATASESSDGVMVDREGLKDKLTDQFLNADAENREFVEQAVATPAAITTEEGQRAADRANAAIAHGANFSYGGTSWSEDSATLGSWISTNIVKDSNGESDLSVYFDPQKARSDISEYAKSSFADGQETFQFEKEDDGQIKVKLGSEGTMPQVNAAISKLNDSLLGSGADTSAAPSIEIDSVDVPSEMYFNEAVNAGVVCAVSEYTTEYTTGAAERNHNIHLAADLLDDSIVKANGGEWSFNETAGECNEEKGFQSAGSIVGGEVSDEIGGGICQVGTTVFNAVYELGMPVLERHNHSVYISSYPAGRDAAINWPDQDLRWQNETSSDMLLTTSYTSGSLTVTIYGIDPGYTVTTETGQWEEGEEYTTVYSYDDSLAPGYSYVKTSGSDGQSITVTRHVTDSNGDFVRDDAFVSVYEPTDEVIVRGGTEADWAGAAEAA